VHPPVHPTLRAEQVRYVTMHHDVCMCVRYLITKKIAKKVACDAGGRRIDMNRGKFTWQRLALSLKCSTH